MTYSARLPGAAGKGPFGPRVSRTAALPALQPGVVHRVVSITMNHALYDWLS